MSSSPFPNEDLLLYLNISGELFYIVLHRMRSQGIEHNLQSTVTNQLSLGICSPEIVNDILKGQLRISTASFDVMRNLLKDVIDGTIMKISDFSMEKLFELALIATKYQYSVVVHPKDILLVALNHLDTIRRYVKEERAIELAEGFHELLIESYASKNYAQMKAYRSAVLHYLDRVKLKMTNLVRLGLQDENGAFIHHPQKIHPETCVSETGVAYHYDEFGECVEESDFVLSGSEDLEHRQPHSLELNGDRVISLGLSIYDIELPAEVKVSAATKVNLPGKEEVMGKKSSGDERDSMTAVAGLEFCNTLLGRKDENSEVMERRQPFPLDNMTEHPLKVGGFNPIVKESTQTIRIDARIDRGDSKAAIFDKFDEEVEPSSSLRRRASVSELMELMQHLLPVDEN